jgi:hypothetical protein
LFRDVPADTRATFRTAKGATAWIPGIVAPQETGDKVWAKAGNLGDELVVQLLLKKQDSGLWRTKKLVVTTPEDEEDEEEEEEGLPWRRRPGEEEEDDEGSEEEEDEDDEGSDETIASFQAITRVDNVDHPWDTDDHPWDTDDPWERHWAQHYFCGNAPVSLVNTFLAMRRRQQTASLQHTPGVGRGEGVTRTRSSCDTPVRDGSQGVMMTSLGGKVPRPMGLKVKLGRLLVSEEAARAGVSVTGTSPSTVVSLREPQHARGRSVKVNIAINKEIMACNDVQDLCSVIQNRVAEFNHVNGATAFRKLLLTPRHGVARGTVDRALRALEESTLHNIGDFDQQTLASTLHAMAKAKAHYTPTNPLVLEALEGRAEAVAGTFNSQAVANTLWAYATMRREPKEGLMRALEGRAEALVGTFEAQNVANTLWAYATMGREPGAARWEPRDSAAGTGRSQTGSTQGPASPRRSSELRQEQQGQGAKSAEIRRISGWTEPVHCKSAARAGTGRSQT